MSPAATARLQNLGAAHPEWNPWLSVIDEVLTAAADARWTDYVPAASRPAETAPLLAQASVVLPIDFLRRWLKHLIRTAAGCGTPEMATLKNAEKSDTEAVQLFHAALAQNSPHLERIARDCRADEKAFHSVAELMPIPFLHACRSVWGNVDGEFWMESYCPLCGAWPALAEVRGIDKARYLRCARCGKDWPASGLCCVFCKNDDHEELVSLVPQTGGGARMVEGCKRCGGYLKSFNTLQGADPLSVMIDDLGSVDLDIAAVEQGYRRPGGPGHPLNPIVGYSKAAAKANFFWKR